MTRITSTTSGNFSFQKERSAAVATPILLVVRKPHNNHPGNILADGRVNLLYVTVHCSQHHS